ncbi:VOC family protein [Mesorhizobium loti]|uniref:VOC family protein n=1 Tax=Rhizobium loti TaxID=381 RepID=UPI0012BC1A33|nr:hypothetical protein [Mesorhizobium loti]
MAAEKRLLTDRFALEQPGSCPSRDTKAVASWTAIESLRNTYGSIILCSVAAKKPLFRKFDNYLLRVSDLKEAISFYRDRLSHALIWRDAEAAGFALPETDAELVVHLRVGPETDILVDDVDTAFREFLAAAGKAVEPAFDIAIGRCARLCDPFGNVLVILDQTKGTFTTDEERNVVGVEPARYPT